MHLFGHLEFTGFGVKSSVLRVSVGPSSSVMLWRNLSIVYVCIHLYGGCPQIRGTFFGGVPISRIIKLLGSMLGSFIQGNCHIYN